MPRTVQPELLDTLPPQHPDALHNRRDIRLTNRLLGNYRWFQRMLPPRLRPAERILEIGAGTGELAEYLHAERLPLDGLDLWPVPENWPGAHRWHSTDLRTFGGYGDYQVVIGNLIFHQFQDAELASLGAVLRSHARLIMACEPVRRPLSQVLFRVIGSLIGVNHVSLHDAHVSIQGGFVGDELPKALGLAPQQWEISCSTTLFGAYRMIATRRS